MNTCRMEEDQTTTGVGDTEIRECTPEHRRKHYNLDTSSSEEYLELAGIASENPQGSNEGSDTEIGECTPAECRTDSDVATSSGIEDAGNMAASEDSADEFSDGTDEDEGDGIRDISQLGAGAIGVKLQTVHQESYQLVGKDAKSLAQHIVGCCQQPQGEVSAAPQQQQRRGPASDGDERTDQANLSTNCLVSGTRRPQVPGTSDLTPTSTSCVFPGTTSPQVTETSALTTASSSTSCVVPGITSPQVPGTSALTPAPMSSHLPRVPGSMVSQIQTSGLPPVPVTGDSTAVAQYIFIQVQQQFGDVTVKGGKNLNIGGTQNVGTTPAKQEEEEKPLTAAQKIRKWTTSRIQSWTKDMVETDALNKVKEKLHRGATWVTITGRPGEGKSTTAYMALQDQHNQGRQVYQVVSPEEFNEVIMACSNPVILLDDIFGDLEFVTAEWMKWRPSLRPILDVKHPDEYPDEVSMGISTKTEKVSQRTNLDQTQVKQSNPNKNKTVIILVGRDYVLKSSLADLGRMADYISSPQYVVEVSSQRDSYERRKIWRAHAEAKNINFKESDVFRICEVNCPHGFPHVCKMFVTAYEKDSTQFPPETFFQAPISFLNQTLNKLLKDEEKRSLFMAMIKRDGKISGQEMEEEDNLGYKHRDVADDLVGSYLKKEDDTYMFDHPSIYDSVSFILSTKQSKFVIENCTLSFINQRLRLAPPKERGEVGLVANIPWTYATDLAGRFASEIHRRNLLHVLSHQACCNSDFVHLLMDCLKTQFHMCTSDIVKMRDRQSHQSFCELLSSNKSDRLLKYIMEEENISFTPDEGRDILLGVCKNAACSVLKYISGHMELDVNVRYSCKMLTPLMLAAETRDSRFVNQIMSLEPDLNARDSLGVSTFCYLCKNGLTVSVERMLDMGVEVNEDQEFYWRHPLYMAIEKGHLEVVKLLVNRGCDVDNQKGLQCAAVSMNSNMVRFFLNRRVDVDSSVVWGACAAGDLNTVKMLFEKGATVNMSHDGDTPLHSAYVGNHTVVAYLLNKGASVSQASNVTGDTPLHVAAAMWKSAECLDVLLKAGADVNVKNNTGDTPLHTAAAAAAAAAAAYWQSTERLDMLLKAGADVNVKNNAGDTPLHAAAAAASEWESTECVDVLLRGGAYINAQNDTGDTPLHTASAACWRSPEVLDVLVKAAADVNVRNNTGDTPLHRAVAATGGSWEPAKCVDVLLMAGADVNVKNNTGDTPLHTAAAAAGWHSTEHLDVLLKAGADVNVQNNTGDTPLHTAAAAEWLSIKFVNVLVKAGADINVQNNTGDTPLHTAAGWQSTECIDVLLKAGADVNVQNNTGDTPLHTAVAAAWRTSTERLDVLLKAGADVNVQNNIGDTPLHTAAAAAAACWRSTEHLDVLLMAGADVNVRDNTGDTPLHRAVGRISTVCVDVLLKAGADANMRNNAGQTPLHSLKSY